MLYSQKKNIFIFTLILFLSFTAPNISRGQKSNNLSEIETYNTCGDPPETIPRPEFVEDLQNIRRGERRKYARGLQIKLKEFNFNYCIVVSKTVYNSDLTNFKINATASDAEELAWQGARKRFYDSFISEFQVNSFSQGNSMIDKPSFENSYYQFFEREVKGVSPLTSLKQVVVFDECPDNPSYTCYTLAYVRKKELEKRLEEIRKAERENNKQELNILKKKYFDVPKEDLLFLITAETNQLTKIYKNLSNPPLPKVKLELLNDSLQQGDFLDYNINLSKPTSKKSQDIWIKVFLAKKDDSKIAPIQIYPFNGDDWYCFKKEENNKVLKIQNPRISFSDLECNQYKIVVFVSKLNMILPYYTVLKDRSNNIHNLIKFEEINVTIE